MRRLRHFLNGEREVFTTFNVSLFSTVIEILKDNNIPYSTYTKYTGSANRRKGSLHTFFEDTECQTQYYLYVSKNDFEMAEHLIKENYKGE